MAKPGTVRISRMLDVRLQNLKGSGRVIKNDSQVHFFHGAAEALAKVVLFGRAELKPGESSYAQLRLTQNVATKKGDRFVIRFFSPVETIGGGVILDDQPRRHKRSDAKVAQTLRIKETGSGDAQVAQALEEFGRRLPTAGEIAAKLRREETAVAEELAGLCDRGQALEPLPGRYISAAAMDVIWGECRELLELYHSRNPLHAGMKVSELRQKLFKGADFGCADALLGVLRQEGKLRRAGERCAMADFRVVLTKRQKAIRQQLLDIYHQAGVDTPLTEDVVKAFPENQRGEVMPVLESLCTSGELVMLAPHITWHRATYDRVYAIAQAHFSTNETLTLAQFRDLLQTSRKYALAALEYFDKNRYTRKEGDARRALLGFGDEGKML